MNEIDYDGRGPTFPSKFLQKVASVPGKIVAEINMLETCMGAHMKGNGLKLLSKYMKTFSNNFIT